MAHIALALGGGYDVMLGLQDENGVQFKDVGISKGPEIAPDKFGAMEPSTIITIGEDTVFPFSLGRSP